ncbi:MAG: low specificity L-threonine aldolase [Phycisphaerae bacterium]|nr:low specificity L-threonine aldolase [Phycisphaerae bacterium]
MNEHAVDLRSDTITQPTSAMREAMMAAPLGDDVLGDEPTVIALQEQCAKLFGKEDACFVPSGSMANQAAIRALTVPGDQIMAHESSHVYLYECGAPAAISGCSFAFLKGDRGQFTADDVRSLVRPDDHHFPRSRLLVVENTHNKGGGSVWPLEQIESVTAVAREHGMRCHLDGARIWNACAASGHEPDIWARHFDTVSACFSKGLGAPAGSIVVGDHETIRQIHRIRKMLGGAMRQSGFLAGAALHALDHHRERLTEDHARARRLAEGLATCPAIELDPTSVETNIVYFGIPEHDAQAFQAALDAMDVHLLAIGPSMMRAVVSLAVDDDGIDRAIRAILNQLN